MIGKIILGLCIILAAVVLVKPEYADVAWAFAMGILGLIGIICIIIIIIVVIVIVIAFLLMISG